MVAKFHRVAGRRVEQGVELVTAVGVTRVQPGLELRIYSLREVLFRESREVSVEQA